MTSAPVRILSLGDSYTIGEGVSAGDRWPTQLSARLREAGFVMDEPTIIARTGWTTNELNVGIDANEPSGDFDLVTLAIGVNNQYRGRSLNEYRAQFVDLLNRAIAFAQSKASRVIVVSIPDWGVTPFARQSGRSVFRIAAEVDAFNGVAKTEAARAGASFVDITPISRQAAKAEHLIAGDGLHPSRGMYEEWTELILPVALRVLREHL